MNYQKQALKTALYKNTLYQQDHSDMCIAYCTLGLVGEAGEVAEKIKKHLRVGESLEDIKRDPALLKELGDVMWYLACLAHELGFTLEEVQEANIKKLSDRAERNKIIGEGDEM